jgi:hypothetical protein
MHDDICQRHLFPQSHRQIASPSRNVRIGDQQQSHRAILQQAA